MVTFPASVPPWIAGRTFADSDGDDPSRVGGPGDPLLSGETQLSSIISFRDNHSGVARSLQRASAAQASKSGEKLLVQAFNEIQNMCDQISLPRIVSDSAKQLFKRQEDEKILRGKPLTAIIAACIYVACREQHVGRTFKEIAALSGVPKKVIAQCFTRLQQTFGSAAAAAISSGNALANPQIAGGAIFSASSASGLVTRFCNHLGLPPAVQSATTEVVRKIDDLGILAGRSPLSVASACVYFTSHAFGMGKGVKEIGQVAGVSESTLRLCYRILMTKKEELLSKRWFTQRDAGSLVADLKRVPQVETREAKAEAKAEAAASASIRSATPTPAAAAATNNGSAPPSPSSTSSASGNVDTANGEQTGTVKSA